ncbi:hypothetical protein [Jidongwangia harbinensis]|uniref:hypothetical protein n=1 Tax=Jidongwangia harbinensis TaxID=2878561 RepID=UPI001CD9EB95|nr:hypothetical protein [Jidongwangia harbinensis]MCA2218272.1 hypothetical protein [Jidongwangia harbinensis]
MVDDSKADAAFSELAAALAAEGFAEGKMFGLRCLKYGGKAVVALHSGGAAVKLGNGSAAHAAAQRLPGAAEFDPAGGRPMKDWVWLPADESAQWPEYARLAGEKIG